jgi:hypothetical protein
MFYIMQEVTPRPRPGAEVATSRGIIDGEWATKAEAAAAAVALAAITPGVLTVVKAVALVRTQPTVEDVA